MKMAEQKELQNQEYYGGFHRCSLEPPIHMEYASDSFCSLVGYTRDEIHRLFDDKLIGMVYEDDREKFREYVRSLVREEQTLTLHYRMVKKNGNLVYVSDTQTSRRMDNGRLYGFGVVADITEYMESTGKNGELFSGIDLPCGIMKCTCDKYPSIISANRNMDEIMHAGCGAAEWTSFALDNIFFMIPFEERDMFRQWIDEAMRERTPISVEHSLIRCDGSRIPVMGWITATGDELTFVYMRVTDRHIALQRNRENSYLKALKNAYNAMFEINFVRRTVECIHENDPRLTRNTYGICMTIESAFEFWIGRTTVPEDREMAEDYFNRILHTEEIEEGGRPLQMVFRIMLEDGNMRKILGVSVKLDSTTLLFCCRDVTDVKYDREAVRPDREAPKVFIRTFGYFDMFAGRETIRFSNTKEKELMAILVDRKGGNVTGENAISLLWEDEVLSENLKTRYRKLAMGLKNTLEHYGVGDVLVNERGVRHINTEAVTCDYYEAIAGNSKYRNLFSGVYMQNYSWAEETLTLLIQTL